MRETELYSTIPGTKEPLEAPGVEVDSAEGEVRGHVAHLEAKPKGGRCRRACFRHDTVESVSMDRWGRHISAVRHGIADGGKRIAFNRFHVVVHLGNAVDQVPSWRPPGRMPVG